MLVLEDIASGPYYLQGLFCCRDLTREMCLDILRENWSPALTTARDGQDHHFLVILKIKIRSTKKCDLEDQDQITQAH